MLEIQTKHQDYIKIYLIRKQSENLVRTDYIFVKGALSGLRQFLATESPFKNDEKYFSFQLKIFPFSR